MKHKALRKVMISMVLCFLLSLLYYSIGYDGVKAESAKDLPKLVLLQHDFPNSIKSTQVGMYQPYHTGKVDNGFAEVMKFVGTSDQGSNGVKTDITEYVQMGKSGDIFGASIKIKVQGWNAPANKNNKVKLFFEIVSKNGDKKVVELSSKGPNSSLSNLTDSKYHLGDNWLTDTIEGQKKLEFQSTDKIYLCITQKNMFHWYDEIALYGYIDPKVNHNVVKVSTPTLTESGDTMSFTASNSKDKKESITIEVDKKTYKKSLKANSKEVTITIPAKKGNTIQIKDNEGNVLIPNMKIGEQKWVATWATANQALDKNRSEYPPNPGLANNTLRQVVRISTGGTQFRLKLSNEYGTSPLEIKAVHLAKEVNPGESRIALGSDSKVTFDGKECITIPAGKTISSDPIEFLANPLERIAITMHFGAVPNRITSHTGARNTSYLVTGDHVQDFILVDAKTFVHWYFITALDVMSNSNAKAIAILGDSITDGYGVTANKDERWTDTLAERLLANDETSHISVLNQGIGGNAIFGGLGPAAINRYKRDILDHEGVGYVIIFEGINDIGAANNTALTQRIINEYIKFANEAKAKGIKVYGATILPFQGSAGYYNATHGTIREQIRQDLNHWIRNNEYFDGVIDLDVALQDVNRPSYLAKEYDNDGLHPSIKGYEKIGESIDLNLFIN